MENRIERWQSEKTPIWDLFLNRSNKLYFHIVKCPWCASGIKCDIGTTLLDTVKDTISAFEKGK